MAAAVTAVALSATPSRAAVLYTLTGNAIEHPEAGMAISFTLLAPTFITTEQEDVQLTTCSTGSAAFLCTTPPVAHFRPGEEKEAGLFLDQIDFVWINADNSGGGSGQVVFALGALSTPGIYNIVYPSFAEAVLTVAVVDQVPLPAALPLFASGLGLMGFLGYRRNRKVAAAARA
jgi:hypothetical protein